jgi:aldehyde:ferredoxin oxidoreductase
MVMRFEGKVAIVTGSSTGIGEAFEKMKDEYYQLRKWDVCTGLQTRAQLEEVGLGDVAQDLERRGWVAITRQMN